MVNFRLGKSKTNRNGNFAASFVIYNIPHIIHISGREKGIGNLIFENHSENKETKNSNQLLGELFQLLSTNTQCVILNGCYLEDQAMAIVRHIDCLIAISQDLEEKTSISFLVELYYHLGLGINLVYLETWSF